MKYNFFTDILVLTLSVYTDILYAADNNKKSNRNGFVPNPCEGGKIAVESKDDSDVNTPSRGKSENFCVQALSHLRQVRKSSRQLLNAFQSIVSI